MFFSLTHMKKYAFDMAIFSLNKLSHFLWEIMRKVICIITQLNISALYDAARLAVLAWTLESILAYILNSGHPFPLIKECWKNTEEIQVVFPRKI